MFCPTRFRNLFGPKQLETKRNKRREHPEDVPLKSSPENEQVQVSLENIQEDDTEDKYVWKKYTFKKDEKMMADLFQQITEFRSLIQLLHQGNIIAFETTLNKLPREQLDTLEFGGQFILHLICWQKDIDALKLFLNLDVKIHIKNADGITPLHIAVHEDWVEGVDELLAKGALAKELPLDSKFGRFPWHEYPIHTAARNGNFDMALSLLLVFDNLEDGNHDTASILQRRKIELIFPNSEGNTVLHLAALSHCSELITMLVCNKIWPETFNETNKDGNSPLHLLMLGKNLDADETKVLECAQMLLKSGADINGKNLAGRTPLFLAVRFNLPLLVEALLNAGADTNERDNDGRNALHAACKFDSPESLSLLIENRKVRGLILQEDNRKFVPFHYAVSTCATACCELLLKNGDHLTNKDSKGRTRCFLVLTYMPSGLLVLKNIFDASIALSNDKLDDRDFKIEMKFLALLSPSKEDLVTSAIVDLNNKNGDSLLKHPLIESFLYLKWQKIKAFFYFYVVLYFTFLLIHTFYIIKTFEMNTDWQNEKEMLVAISWCHYILLFLLALPSALLIFGNFFKYVKQWETYFKMVALPFSAFVVFSRDAEFLTAETKRNVATFSIFFTWVEFMMLLGRFPSLGNYILMFTTVSKSILKFLFAFSPLIIAFSLAFNIMFTEVETFNSYPTVFVRTLMMLIGEIDFSTIYDNIKGRDTFTRILIQIFLVVFVILIPILMANLLIGLAVSDLPDLQLHGKIRGLVKKASYIESYERLMMLFFKDTSRFPLVGSVSIFGKNSVKDKKLTIYPNQRHDRSNKKLVIIPKAVIEAAIASGEKEFVVENHEATFKRFLGEYEENQLSFKKMYMEDRLRFERALQAIFDVIHEKSSEKQNVESAGERGIAARKKALFEKKSRLFGDSADMSY